MMNSQPFDIGEDLVRLAQEHAAFGSTREEIKIACSAAVTEYIMGDVDSVTYWEVLDYVVQLAPLITEAYTAVIISLIASGITDVNNTFDVESAQEAFINYMVRD